VLAATAALAGLAADAPLLRADSAAPDRVGVGVAGGSELRQRLDRALRVRALRGARVAAWVVGEDGRELFARDPDRRLTPASNVKVLTALAVLARLGPTHRFETLLLADAPPDAEGAVQTLLLRGGGDPAVNSEDWWRVADALRTRGLRRVRGDLVLDDTLFDRERWHPSWGRPSARSYHAPVGALTANYGAFAVEVRPGNAVGAAARVLVVPPVRYLRLVNRAATTRSRRHTKLRVDRESGADGELVVASGEIRLGEDSVAFYRSVQDPARYAGSLLRLQLEAVGVTIDGVVRVGTDLGDEATATVLYRHEGRTLAEIVKLCMKYSNNQIAESLVKTLALKAGATRGSWREGSRELRRVLVGLGVDAEGFTLVDGSGLSYENKASPRALVQALQIAARSFDFGPELLAALPLADLDGTLADRAAGASGAVRAKTGTLTRTTALSGFARLSNGERAVFSILVNGYRSGDRDAMNALDDFVTALVAAPVTRPE
jgi:D-alanyl-D-alanine carboxypeptidase/D-alanyl-D-alanine-endopeptidase (penicillin-binding protein 4)